MILRSLSATALLALAAACTAPQSSAPVRVADASQVGQCKYLEDLNNRPGLYGQLATQGVEYARKAILDQAAADGANTVVFQKVDPGAMVTELKATAYRC